jgi:transcription elongation GreA/GreB family factor
MVTFVQKMDFNFKVDFKNFLTLKIKDEISVLQNEQNLLQQGLEAKSSAGDKHNTEQAMQHLEEEKKAQQLHIWLKNLQNLNRTPTAPSTTIQIGSLVQTNNGVFYLSIPYGNCTYQNKNIVVLSIQSPVGKLFQGKKTGDEIHFNQKSYKIIKID